MNEKEKQKKFAYYWAITRNPEQAAIICGEPNRWLEWMENKQVLRELYKLQRKFRKESPGDIAKRGLEQIVFSMIPNFEKSNSPCEDADEESGYCTEELSYRQFQIAEWKKPKGGGEEVKFWDKLKALELLIRLEEEKGKQENQGGQAVYRALESGARALKGFNQKSELCATCEGEMDEAEPTLQEMRLG